MNLNSPPNHPDWEDYRDGCLSKIDERAFEDFLAGSSDARQLYDLESELLASLKWQDQASDFINTQDLFTSKVIAAFNTTSQPSLFTKINRYLIPFTAAAIILFTILLGQMQFLEPQAQTHVRQNPVGTLLSMGTTQAKQQEKFIKNLLDDTQRVFRVKHLLHFVTQNIKPQADTQMIYQDHFIDKDLF